MSWKRTRTTSTGKIRHSGYYRDPTGATRSAGTFTRVKDALSAKGTWTDPDAPVVTLDQPTLRWYVGNKWCPTGAWN